MVFIPLRDAQEGQFHKDNDAIINERARVLANPDAPMRKPARGGSLVNPEGCQRGGYLECPT